MEIKFGTALNCTKCVENGDSWGRNIVTRERYFTNCAEAWMERAETDPRSGDMRKVPDKHRFPPFCMEEKGEAWKKGYLHTLIISDFLLQGPSSPLLYTNRCMGKELEGRASPTLGNCLLYSQCRFIEKLTWNITLLNTHAQMFSHPCG